MTEQETFSTNPAILLVDDESHILSALTRSLRNSPYQLLTAESAVQALEIMETTKIMVIVTDEQMVGMRGSELLAEVQKRFPHTIRILLTGHATLEAAIRAVNDGVISRFLTKPWDDGMLRLALSAATEKYNSDAEKRRLQDALEEERRRLQRALDEVKTLRGILPICAYCKKIRDDAGYWNQVEKYVSDHTDAKFSHGICPACFEREMKAVETSA